MVIEQKSWNNKCPKCGSYLKWRMSNSKPGSSSHVSCSKSLDSTFITSNLKSIRICDWVGKAVRQPDGSIRFKDSLGRWISEFNQE